MGRPDEPLRFTGKSRVRKRRGTHQGELLSKPGRKTRGANRARTQAREIREREFFLGGGQRARNRAGRDSVGKYNDKLEARQGEWFYREESKREQIGEPGNSNKAEVATAVAVAVAAAERMIDSRVRWGDGEDFGG